MTRDRHLIVLHDIHLDTVTDVADAFPGRARQDGRYHALDFDLAEVRSLRAHERIDPDTGKSAFPNRFPLGEPGFRLHSFEEELAFIAGLNRSTGRRVGIYPEIKKPAWHRAQGHDISTEVLEILDRYGYNQPEAQVFLQCFDAAELKRLKTELKVAVPLIQLIGENGWNEADTDYQQLQTESGLKAVAEYARGIGPWLPQVALADSAGRLTSTGLVEKAHKLGLLVHPYTVRREQLPAGIDSVAAFVRRLYIQIGVDGLFIDSPDDAVAVLNARDP